MCFADRSDKGFVGDPVASDYAYYDHVAVHIYHRPPHQPPSSPPPSLPPTMGWFWGEDGENCNDACARHSQVCDTVWTRLNILPYVQNYEEFVTAAAQADQNGGGPQLDVEGNPNCNEGTFETEPLGPWPAVALSPSYRCGTSGTCQGEAGCGGEVGTPYGYTCDASVAGIHRMCYCLPGVLAIKPHKCTFECTQ